MSVTIPFQYRVQCSLQIIHSYFNQGMNLKVFYEKTFFLVNHNWRVSFVFVFLQAKDPYVNIMTMATLSLKIVHFEDTWLLFHILKHTY